MTTYLQLFLSFLKIGFTSFSGLSMIPMIRQETVRYGWMTDEELVDLIAIAEATPGPLALNSATFAGMRDSGSGSCRTRCPCAKPDGCSMCGSLF